MLIYIKELFNELTNIGTNHCLNSSSILKVQIMNNVIFLSLFMGLSCVVIGLYQGDVIYTIANIFVSISLVSCILLIQKNKTKFAWYIILTIPVLVLTFLPLMSKMVITTIIYYIVFQTLVFALFNERIIVISFSIFYGIMALLFLYFFYQGNDEGLTSDDFLATGASLVLGVFLEFLALLMVLTIREDQSRAFKLKEATFKSIFENSPIGVIVSQREMNTPKMINERMAMMFGYEVEEFSLKKISEISHPEDREIHEPFYNQLLQGKISFFEMEKRYIHKKGHTLWARTAISLVRNKDNKPIHTVAMIQDITQQKKQEKRIHELLEKLKILNVELEQTIDERTKKLIKTNEELMRSNEDLEQFAYAASHDLQEPLRMVGNFVQLLDRKYGDKLDENGKTYINFAVEGVTRMSQLIKSLLQYSRAGRKEAAVRIVDVRKVIEHKLLDLEQLIKDKNAVITIEQMPKKITCEPVQVGLIFYNLIVNGLKFNKKEQPLITIGCNELEGHWCFEVTDNGIGIEDTYKDKIFEIFKRLNRRDEYDGTGTGIGLALCKKIAYRHKGEVWFDSSLGSGTTFYFTIAKELHHS